MALSPDETRRYARHIVLKGFGGAGQGALSAAHVAVVGAGGLGAPVIAYLAAAGVGRLSIIDPGILDLPDLQRQIIHAHAAIGQNKARSAADFVAALNRHVAVSAHAVALTPEKGKALLEDCDLVVEATDSFSARADIAALCEALEIPLVSGAVSAFDGQVTVLAPHLRDDKGRPGPRFADLFAVAPGAGEIPSCEEAGVLSPLVGVIGTMMANEAIKVIAGHAPALIGKLLLYASRSAETTTIRYTRRDEEAAR